MRPDDEVLTILRELYEKMNKDPGEIMQVRSKDENYYAKRADGAIAKFPNKLIEEHCGSPTKETEHELRKILDAGFFVIKK
jgi:hypothetical protein